MRAIVARAPGIVIPLPPAASRPLRRPIGADERRGEILLFMGVRYERLEDGCAEPAPQPAKPQRVRSRRRHS